MVDMAGRYVWRKKKIVLQAWDLLREPRWLTV